MKNIHIGSIIQEYVYNHGISPQWLAHKIGCSRGNIYKIYAKKSIDVELLVKISIALNFNFLNEYNSKLTFNCIQTNDNT